MSPEPYESRHRAGVDELEATFAWIGDRLAAPVVAYDIGGGPMVYRGLKDATKDVDLVVLSNRDRDAIKDVLLHAGYHVEGELPGYEGLDGLLIQKTGHVGVDIFVVRIMEKFHLSPTMRQRAEGPHEFGRLQVHHCANEDIFLLKAITWRPDDDDDVVTLARAGLNARTLYDEVRVQERLDPNNWPWVIFRALEDVERRKGVALPIKSDLVD